MWVREGGGSKCGQKRVEVCGQERTGKEVAGKGGGGVWGTMRREKDGGEGKGGRGEQRD